MKVGTLAQRTGLSVRTLHHYDEIGLLTPARRTPSGHRLYGEAEARRLQRIASLRQLGLSLEEIDRCLENPEYTLEEVLELHIRRLRERIEEEKRLCRRLEALLGHLEEQDRVSLDDLTGTIEETLQVERYYTPEQLEQLRRRGEDVGEARIAEAQREWQELFEAFADALEEGLEPGSPEVQELAGHSAALVREFTGGHAGVEASLARMYREEGPENVMASFGVELAPGVWELMARAREIRREAGDDSAGGEG